MTFGRILSSAIIVLWFPLMAAVLAAPSLFALEQPGDFLIRNTVRVSLIYWAVAVVLMMRRDPFARVYWSLACAAYIVHVVVSFEHVHRWSHAAAFAHVKAASGYGEGIFVSYFFTLLWCVDALFWWVAPRRYETRPAWVCWSIHGFMLFIIINGTVIFENGAIRWISVAVFAALLGIWLKSRDTRQPNEITAIADQ